MLQWFVEYGSHSRKIPDLDCAIVARGHEPSTTRIELRLVHWATVVNAEQRQSIRIPAGRVTPRTSCYSAQFGGATQRASLRFGLGKVLPSVRETDTGRCHRKGTERSGLSGRFARNHGADVPSRVRSLRSHSQIHPVSIR